MRVVDLNSNSRVDLLFAGGHSGTIGGIINAIVVLLDVTRIHQKTSSSWKLALIFADSSVPDGGFFV